MSTASSTVDGTIVEKLSRAGQLHLLDFLDDLNTSQRQSFLHQLAGIDFDRAAALFAKAASRQPVATPSMAPLPDDIIQSEASCDPATLQEYQRRGLEEISKSRVAVLLMAGGQGTRLGVSYPKGMYSVGLPSEKTLFRIQAERLRRLIALAKQQTGVTGKICWYIMTSESTDSTTKSYLARNDYFGLDPRDVVLFEQGVLPCFDGDGRILLDRKDSVALAPDGNGGVYRALKLRGVLDDMRRRGVRHVHAYSVDNILVKVADPAFIGYCVLKGAECGAKVVKKSRPDEAVGVVCLADGKYRVVEYSEIGAAAARLTRPDGSLTFDAANICNHFFAVEFLERVAEAHEPDLKLHVARKKIPHVGADGRRVTPDSARGVKIEKFVFDAFEFAERFAAWEVARGGEFSALKNADEAGVDCPSACRGDLLRLHRRWIERAGGIVDCDEVEVSPLLSYGGENLEVRVKGKVFDKKTVLLSDEELLILNNNNDIESNGSSNGDRTH